MVSITLPTTCANGPEIFNWWELLGFFCYEFYIQPHQHSDQFEISSIQHIIIISPTRTARHRPLTYCPTSLVPRPSILPYPPKIVIHPLPVSFQQRAGGRQELRLPVCGLESRTFLPNQLSILRQLANLGGHVHNLYSLTDDFSPWWVL